jgi:ribosome biogenesis ATPase
MESITTQLMELIGLPILHPEIYLSTGVEPPRGVLLYGPPGCGKTTIANALAGELGVPFISISAPSIVSGMSGESEKKLREIFEDAKNIAPCLIFMDEIDSITPKRDGGAQREMERRIVAQLLTLMDELTLDKTNGKPVIVMGATNRPDSLDSALRRAGRFDREICLNVPNEDQRVSILRAMTANLKLAADEFNFKKLAKLTPGFVGADLKSLVTAAGVFAIKRIFESLSEQQELEDLMENNSMKNSEATTDGSMEVDDVNSKDLIQKFESKTDDQKLSIIQKFLMKHPAPLTDEQLGPLSINFQDFLSALPTIQPTAKREGFATIPDVSWDNVGALNRIRMELHMCIVQPIKKPEIFQRVGITAPAGVLMWGPPGCGKTLLAKAVANESRANFISIKGPELLNKYVGESERAIRQVFQRARASVPCIIFFDELDALVPKRDNSLSESSSRVVNTLLTELDGLNDRKGVFVIGATNRPDIIDPAMIRPGRLDKSLYIELPTEEERLDILQTLIKSNGTPVDASVNLKEIVSHPKCRNFSGADLSSLVREAGVIALKKRFFNSKVDVLDKSEFVNEDDDISSDIYVGSDDFLTALHNIKPSVSDKDRIKYDKLNKRIGPVVEDTTNTANDNE